MKWFQEFYGSANHRLAHTARLRQSQAWKFQLRQPGILGGNGGKVKAKYSYTATQRGAWDLGGKAIGKSDRPAATRPPPPVARRGKNVLYVQRTANLYQFVVTRFSTEKATFSVLIQLDPFLVGQPRSDPHAYFKGRGHRAYTF